MVYKICQLGEENHNIISQASRDQMCPSMMTLVGLILLTESVATSSLVMQYNSLRIKLYLFINS